MAKVRVTKNEDLGSDHYAEILLVGETYEYSARCWSDKRADFRLGNNWYEFKVLGDARLATGGYVSFEEACDRCKVTNPDSVLDAVFQQLVEGDSRA